MVSVSFFFWQKNIRRVKENRIFFIRIQRTLFFLFGSQRRIFPSSRFRSMISTAHPAFDGRNVEGFRDALFLLVLLPSRSKSFRRSRFPARGTPRFGISEIGLNRYAKITAHHRARGRSGSRSLATNPKNDDDDVKKQNKRRALCRRT